MDDRQERRERSRRFLEKEVWPRIPPDLRGRPITKAEREEILGIGPDGYCYPSGDFAHTDLELVDY